MLFKLLDLRCQKVFHHITVALASDSKRITCSVFKEEDPMIPPYQTPHQTVT
ncbi:unnamed protein product [Acanthoscelides obtectus]|uniref:Uncharacterized protein n=1 Tax=Acanthoscelides obtectus TaxID=200917 RepID=A0A9P0PRG9_ACAOB|nr:unnamed protein product [Acanthoscelides obtectus]CAK1650098.1 hypothetical protein AOBTE_LOCUS16598 [Acanthoscelides obtectus]